MRQLAIPAALLFLILSAPQGLAQDAPQGATPLSREDALAAARAAAAAQIPDTTEYASAPAGLLTLPDPNAGAKAEEEQAEAQPPLGRIPGVYNIPGVDNNVGGNEILTLDQITNLYKKGDYATVLRHLEPLVVSKQHSAEELMGIMYANGQGVEKDEAHALELLGRAAEAGRPLAQHYLGIMYFTGQGLSVPDTIKGLMWLRLSILHYPEGPDKERAKQDRDNSYLKTTRLERSRADDMAREWLSTHGEEHLMDLAQ